MQVQKGAGDCAWDWAPDLAGASSTPLLAKQHPHSQPAPLLALTSAQARILAASSPFRYL